MPLRDLLRPRERATGGAALADPPAPGTEPEPATPPAPEDQQPTEETPAVTSTKDAAALILREHGGPMHVKAIAAAVLERNLAPGLKGKTPEATIAAQIAVDAKRENGRFTKVDRGIYDLRDR